MFVIIVLAALAFLVSAAYRGYSVILFVLPAALGAVLLTDPSAVAPASSDIFMEKMAGLVRLYFPVFLLGTVFGKVIELSGSSRFIVASVTRVAGAEWAILSTVLVYVLLTYGGVSLFVVVFAVCPFAAEMFCQGNIPKRLIPGTTALGAFSFTMDLLSGTPQIQNIIPTTFFHTTPWAASWLGIIGMLSIIVVGMSYLEWRRRVALRYGQGYDHGLTKLVNEPKAAETGMLAHPLVALSLLVLVGVMNLLFTCWIPTWYGKVVTVALPRLPKSLTVEAGKLTVIWAVETVLLTGIIVVFVFGFHAVRGRFADGGKAAVSGVLLAAMNIASEYGFGGVIAALLGSLALADDLRVIPNPFVNEAVTVSILAGTTGSVSDGMSIALAAMVDQFAQAAQATGTPMEVLHRVAAMASGGMDTLPHNGVMITLLAAAGLMHREAYRDVFYVMIIKTLAVFFVIAMFYVTGIV